MFLANTFELSDVSCTLKQDKPQGWVSVWEGRGILGESYRLDDLEHRRPAHDEHEQREEPRSYWVLVVFFLSGFRYIAPHGDVFAGDLVGDAHPLFRCHFI